MIDWERVRSEGWAWRNPDKLRILAIDGGGVRGIFPAKYLALLEASTGRQIYEMFDMIVGTSTGGIISLALAAGITAQTVCTQYQENTKDMFRGSVFRRVPLLAPKYENEPLQKLLADLLGETTIKDARTMLCIPSVEHQKASPTIFKTPHRQDLYYDQNKTMCEAALSTSAAPTFFRPYMPTYGCKLDGGLWANCPVVVGIAEAVRNGTSLEDILVLSLGTGEFPYGANRKTAWKSSWLSHCWKFPAFLAALQVKAALNTATYLIGSNCIRVSCTLPRDIPLDSTSDEDIHILLQEAEVGFRDTFRKGPNVERLFCVLDNS